MKVFEWLRWLVWDSWHGVSVSAFDERRASQFQAPALEAPSGLRIPRWLIYLLAFVAFLALLVLVLRLFGVVLTTAQDSAVASQPGLFESVNACVVKERSTGRNFVAVDCLLEVSAGWLWAQVPAILLFVVGFITGWTFRGSKNGE